MLKMKKLLPLALYAKILFSVSKNREGGVDTLAHLSLVSETCKVTCQQRYHLQFDEPSISNETSLCEQNEFSNISIRTLD